MIREATSSDKMKILEFCKNTFSWGDYIEDVWDYWISEGNLLVVEKKTPIGICHAYFSKNQVWIEGIRINPNHRKQGFASSLVKQVELMAINKKNFPILNADRRTKYFVTCNVKKFGLQNLSNLEFLFPFTSQK